jgi:DNA polymerase-3 subunit alpha
MIPEITKRDFDALVKSGAADNMIRRSIANGQHVPPEQFRIDALSQFSEFPKRCSNQLSLFSLFGQEDRVLMVGQSEMLDTNVMLNYEFDVLERFVTDHPARIARNRKRLSNTAKIEDLLPDRTYILTVMMRGVKVIETKKGDEMAFLMFEDETGILDVTTFSDFYLENKSIIKERGVYVVWLKTQFYKDKMSATITHLEYA